MEITMHGNRFELAGTPIQTDKQAPDFTAVSPDLKPVKLSDYRNKIIVISSFPSPGIWIFLPVSFWLVQFVSVVFRR